MKTFKMVTIVFAFALLTTGPAFAGDSLESENGYWDFDGSVEAVGADILVSVWNKSTDASSSSDECKAGMASVVVDIELWHADVEILGSARLGFLNVCNGGMAEYVAAPIVSPEYVELEIRFNVTTPDGQHSFSKGSVSWHR